MPTVSVSDFDGADSSEENNFLTSISDRGLVSELKIMIRSLFAESFQTFALIRDVLIELLECFLGILLKKPLTTMAPPR